MAKLVIDRLRALQEADQNLRRLEAEKAAHDRSIRIRGRQIGRLREELKGLEAERKQARVHLDQKELEIREKKGQIEKLRQQQMQVKDNRQYQALQNEIKFAELSISKIEDEMLSDYEDLERIEGRIAETKEELFREEEALEAFRREMEAQKDEVDARIEQCRADRREIADALPPDAVAQFNRTADRWEGEALAKVVRDEDGGFSCAGCNMSVTQNTYVLLMGRTEDLLTCPNCSRILYVDEV